MMFRASIDSESTKFILSDVLSDEKAVFDGTVAGAIALLKKVAEEDYIYFQLTSDFNHPDEFPKFEKYAIDIVAGCWDDAISAGVLKFEKG